MTDMMCQTCRGKGQYAGLVVTCRSCSGSGLERASTGQQTQDSPIPDTDLIRIAEREVIEAAKRWYQEVGRVGLSGYETDELFAAVSLLESREQSEKERR